MMETCQTNAVDQSSLSVVLPLFSMKPHNLVGRVIPNGNCSHGKKRLLITISDKDAHKLQNLLNKQVKVTIQCI